MNRALLVLLFIVVPLTGNASGVRLKTVDTSGAPFPSVLIIVRSLSTNIEEGRFLTDEKGAVSEFQLSAGLHQVIATCPYGLCKTTVQEFFVDSRSQAFVLTVPFKSTDEIGELIGARDITLVLKPLGIHQATASAKRLYVRDAQAIRQKWCELDAGGKVTIQLFGDRTHVVIPAAGSIEQYDLRDRCPPESKGEDRTTTCIVIGPGATEAVIPFR